MAMPVADMLKDAAIPLFALAQGLFGPLSLGDVGEGRDAAGYVSVRIAQGRRVTVEKAPFAI